MEDVSKILIILLGNFSNKIALNEYIRSDMNFKDFALELDKHSAEAISHGIYPYEVLEKNLNLDKNNSLFDVMFEFIKTETNVFDIDSNEIKIFTKMTNEHYNSKLCFKVDSSLSELSLEFNKNLFKLSTAKSILSHYLFILKQVIKNQSLKISDFEMITPEEIRLLEKFNAENVSTYVLDKNMKLVPIGVTGIIYECLSDKDKIENKDIIDNPICKGKIYKTDNVRQMDI